MTPLVAPDRSGPRRSLIDADPDLRWLVVACAGMAISVIGWTDLILLWYPLNFGSFDWEFGTISAHFDGMPLGTIGIALLAVGAMASGWRGVTRAVGVLCLVVTVLVLSIYAVYLLTVPVAMKGVAPQLLPVMKKGVLKATVFAATYTVFYAWLGWFLWRKTRLTRA